ncbi:hypothetical protein C9419_21570 [Paraburkholderia fungorum]|nr:hypothetical protein C9419_21570 [Paraburkholderia fungorum]
MYLPKNGPRALALSAIPRDAAAARHASVSWRCASVAARLKALPGVRHCTGRLRHSPAQLRANIGTGV